jgi:hypothetical protein
VFLKNEVESLKIMDRSISGIGGRALALSFMIRLFSESRRKVLHRFSHSRSSSHQMNFVGIGKSKMVPLNIMMTQTFRFTNKWSDTIRWNAWFVSGAQKLNGVKPVSDPTLSKYVTHSNMMKASCARKDTRFFVSFYRQHTRFQWLIEKVLLMRLHIKFQILLNLATMGSFYLNSTKVQAAAMQILWSGAV